MACSRAMPPLRRTTPAGPRPAAWRLLAGALAVVALVAGLAWWWWQAAPQPEERRVAATVVADVVVRPVPPPVSRALARPAVTALAVSTPLGEASADCLASRSTLGRLRAAAAGALADDSVLQPLLARIETEEYRAQQAGAALHAAAVQRLRASTDLPTRAIGLQLAAMLQPNSPADCQGDDCTAALQAARQQARAPLAELATLALGSNDALVYARAWSACQQASQPPADVPACSQLSAQRWAQLAPDTAAPWLVMAALALAAGDVAGELNAMHRAALAPDWRNSAGGLLRPLLVQTAPVPAAPLVRWHAEFHALSAELGVASMVAPIALQFCAAPLDSNRLQTCTQLANRMLAAPEDLMQLSLAIAMARRVGLPAEQVAVRQREFDALMAASASQARHLAVPGADAALNTATLCAGMAAMHQHLVRWADGGELAALRALLPAAAGAAPARTAPAAAASAQAR